MNLEEAIAYGNDYYRDLVTACCEIDEKHKEFVRMSLKALEQESLCDRLAREYISKVKYCDECFASTFCTINGLRNSRVPQSYCIENIKKYFESKSEGKE
jgi:hypothetical protein